MRLVPYDPVRMTKGPVQALLAEAAFPPTADRAAALLAATYTRPRVTLYLAYEAQELVGLIGLHRTARDRGEVTHIAVQPGRRRQGVGRSMLLELRHHLGLRELVAETDGEALGFYRRCGFRVRSLGETYPGVERFHCRLTGPPV